MQAHLSSITVNDLFPETLLVNLVDGQPMTNTLHIAQYFGKRHRDVLRSVRRAITRLQDPRRLRNFAQSSYLNEQGKRQPMYLLSKDGFYFVTHKFTGAAAEKWQWAFIDAFNAQEAELAAIQARYLAALDQIRPSLRPVVEGTQAGYSRAEIAAPLGKSLAAITYHRASARRLGLLDFA